MVQVLLLRVALVMMLKLFTIHQVHKFELLLGSNHEDLQVDRLIASEYFGWHINYC